MDEPWKKYSKPWEKYGGAAIEQTQPTPADAYAPIGNVFRGVGNKFQEAAGYFNKGDIPAGMASGGRAGLQALFSPVNAGLEGLRQIPVVGEPVVGGIEALAGILPKILSYSASGYLGGAQKLGLPISDAAVQEGSGLAGDVGAIALAPRIVKGGAEAIGDLRAGIKTRAGVKGTAGILEAYPPSKAASAADRAVRYREEQVPIAAKYIAEDARTSGVSQNPKEFGETTSRLKDEIWQKADVTKKPYAQATLNPSDVVDRVVEDLPEHFRKTYPDRVAEIKNELSRFQQDYTMEQTQGLLTTLNAEQKPIYDANGVKVANTLKKDYVLNAEKQFTDGLREKFFDTAKSYGDQSIEPLRKDYGAMATLDNEVRGAMEKNMAKDKKSVFEGSLRKGFYAGVLTTIATHNPALAGAVDAGVTGGGIFSKIRSKPSAMIKRSVGQLAKSDLSVEKSPYNPPVPYGLLPPPSSIIMPEYQSRASGFPNAAPQMADQLRVLQSKFASGEFSFEQYLAGLKEIPNMENMMRVIAQQKYPK